MCCKKLEDCVAELQTRLNTWCQLTTIFKGVENISGQKVARFGTDSLQHQALVEASPCGRPFYIRHIIGRWLASYRLKIKCVLKHKSNLVGNMWTGMNSEAFLKALTGMNLWSKVLVQTNCEITLPKNLMRELHVSSLPCGPPANLFFQSLSSTAVKNLKININ